jgi:hypothetical protein
MVFTRRKVGMGYAVELVEEALNIAYNYRRDSQYVPSEEELAQFFRFAYTLESAHATAAYIARRMQQRHRREAAETTGDTE